MVQSQQLLSLLWLWAMPSFPSQCDSLTRWNSWLRLQPIRRILAPSPGGVAPTNKASYLTPYTIKHGNRSIQWFWKRDLQYVSGRSSKHTALQSKWQTFHGTDTFLHLYGHAFLCPLLNASSAGLHLLTMSPTKKRYHSADSRSPTTFRRWEGNPCASY